MSGEPPIVVDTLDDVKKVIPEDELLEFKVWAPERCESEWGCLDRNKDYLCHDLDGVMVCREWWPPPIWADEEPEREPPWELLKKGVPYKWLSASCCGVEAELAIPMWLGGRTTYLPLVIECWKGRLRVYVDVRELEEMYRDSVVDAIKRALREVWRRTVKLLYYEMVDYDMFEAPEPVSVIKWRPGVKTKYILVPCRRGAITIEVPIQAIVDTVREYVQLVL